MKSIVGILLAVFVVTGATGISVKLHYCGDELVSTTLYYAPQSCCGDEKMPEGCCHNETEYFQQDNEWPASGSIVVPSLFPKIIAAIPVMDILVPFKTPTNSHLFASGLAPPLKPGRHAFLLFRSLLL